MLMARMLKNKKEKPGVPFVFSLPTHMYTQTYWSLYIFILSYHDLPLTALVIEHNTPTGPYVQNVY